MRFHLLALALVLTPALLGSAEALHICGPWDRYVDCETHQVRIAPDELRQLVQRLLGGVKVDVVLP